MSRDAEAPVNAERREPGIETESKADFHFDCGMARRGRPPAAPAGARTQPVRVYFTAAEPARLKAKGQATTCGTFSAFLRHLALSESARLTSRTDAQTILELQRNGHNLNQIARRVNSGLDVSAGEARRVYDELLNVLRSFKCPSSS